MGGDVTARHVVELPGDKKPFKGGLAGLSAFTISGWLKVHSPVEGPGGDRVVNYCGGAGGIDLVWDSEGGGRLKLAVNEWPDGTHPQSSDGSMPVDNVHEWPHWRFFAVTYNANAKGSNTTHSSSSGSTTESSGNNVQFYFGTSKDAATLDAGAINTGSYNRGVKSYTQRQP